MSTFLSKVKGFTPVIDVIVQDIGLMSATVYGVMWRYFQMGDHVCRASLQTIAGRIGTDRSTVQRHAKMLCTAGYIIDTTPERANRPHVYADAGKAIIEGLLEARSVAQNNTTLQSATPRCTEQHHVAENHEKIVLKTASKIAPKKEHGEDAAQTMPHGTAALENIMGPRQHFIPQGKPITSNGDWRERLRDNPHLTWGGESQEIQQQVERYGSRADPILRLGYELEQALGIRPAWSNRQEVKTWTSGLVECLENADHDWQLVVATARQMREEGLSIKNPHSIKGMVTDAAAKRRSRAKEHQRAQQHMEEDPQYQTFKRLREAKEADERSRST